MEGKWVFMPQHHPSYTQTRKQVKLKKTTRTTQGMATEPPLLEMPWRERTERCLPATNQSRAGEGSHYEKQSERKEVSKATRSVAGASQALGRQGSKDTPTIRGLLKPTVPNSRAA